MVQKGLVKAGSGLLRRSKPRGREAQGTLGLWPVVDTFSAWDAASVWKQAGSMTAPLFMPLSSWTPGPGGDLIW